MSTTVPMIFPHDAPRARRSDPVTSHQAADRTTGRGGHAEVLSWLSIYPDGLTDDEIAAKHRRSRKQTGQKPLSGSRLRTARQELVKSKEVVLLGDGTSDAGNPAQRWGIAR